MRSSMVTCTFWANPRKLNGRQSETFYDSSGSQSWKKRLTEQLAAAVLAGRYEAIVLDYLETPYGMPGFDNRYELVETDLSKKVFRPVTGLDCSPTYLS